MSHKRFHTVDAPTVPLNILECYDAAEYVLDELRALSTLVGLTFDEDHPFENLVAIRDAVRVVVDEHAKVRAFIDRQRGLPPRSWWRNPTTATGTFDGGAGGGTIDQYQHYLSHYDPRLTSSNSGGK